MDVSAGVEIAGDGHFARGTNLYQILQNPVDGVFVENADVAKALDVKFQSFQLQAFFIRQVVDFDYGKIGLAGAGANAGELRAGDGNDVVPPGVLVFERLQDFRLYRHGGYIKNGAGDGKRDLD